MTIRPVFEILKLATKKEVEVLDQQTAASQLVQIPDEIRAFLDNLLEEAGMTDMDAQMHEDMLQALYKRLDRYITSSIVSNLPTENLDEFVKMSQQNRPRDEIEQFLRQRIPNSQDVLAKAFLDFRDLYLGNKQSFSANKQSFSANKVTSKTV
ncbi:hypothetical protein HYS93_03695 [Candidatus Daviesbacteria bacterium]|nr:hypothetical protein [Candidatus Daviesbacteria bacterium]